MPKIVTVDLEEVRQEVAAWWGLKRQAKMLETEIQQRRKQLSSLVQKYGEKDDKGNLFLDLGVAVTNDGISQLKNQITISTGLNEEAAKEILEAKGLWVEMTEVVRVIDEARVNAAFYDNKINEDELTQMFPQRVSYSFWPVDEAGKQIR